MSGTNVYGPTGQALDTYLGLVREFPLVPIASDDHLRAAQARIGELLKRSLDAGEDAYLDTLSDLVESYEDETFPDEPLTDAQLLEGLLNAKGITGAELHRQTGVAESSISEVLKGKRSFSKAMIGKFAEFFGVSVGLLSSNLRRR